MTNIHKSINMPSTNSHNHHDHHYYQSLKLLLIAALLVVTPLLSSSLRFKYLYFIVNILIIAVGAEAGLVSFFLAKENNKYNGDDGHQSDNGAKPVKRVFVEAVEVEKILPPSSNPSIFFIGGGESENINIISQAADEELVMDDDEELFQKAEMFIGNFYKQLKMQRDESRKRLADQLY